jgi:recombination DNA repair RAD52 pathway protein
MKYFIFLGYYTTQTNGKMHQKLHFELTNHYIIRRVGTAHHKRKTA